MRVIPCYSFYCNNGIITDHFVLHINTLFRSTASISNIKNDSNDESGQFEPLILQTGLSGEILIRYMSPITTDCFLRIYDMSGKRIHNSLLHDSESIIHLSEGNGIYFIEIENGYTVYRKKMAMIN